MEVAAFVLSCVSIAISIIFGIITIVQNRKLHNENKNLSCKPNLVSTLLWDNKIGGQIVKKNMPLILIMYGNQNIPHITKMGIYTFLKIIMFSQNQYLQYLSKILDLVQQNPSK